VRTAVSRLLRTEGFVVDTFESAQHFLAQDVPNEPWCLVLDVRMPAVGGLELQERLSQAGLDVGIVFLTGHGDVPTSVQAVKRGAVDFLEKPFEADDLVAAIRRAIALCERTRAARNEREGLEARPGVLTPREREVLALVAAGLPNKLVANRLGTTEKTIKAHRGRVMAKMGAPSLAAFVRMADALGVRA
jgi:FixJ family two-component response regulator